MQIETFVQHVRHNLGCATVHLVLNCPDPALRHPLLSRADAFCAALTAYPSLGIGDALDGERLTALCDIAAQTNQPWYCAYASAPLAAEAGARMAGTLLVVPLECPEGVLGFLLCLYKHTDAFSLNECRLIKQSLPHFALQLEALLAEPDQAGRIAPSPGPHTAATSCASQSDEEVTPADGQSDDVQHTPSEMARLDQTSQAVVQMRHECMTIINDVFGVPATTIEEYTGLLRTYEPAPALNDFPIPPANTPLHRQRHLKVLLEQSEYLHTLIGELLDLSRIQAGQLSLRSERVDLAALCRQVIQKMQYSRENVPMIRPEIHCFVDPTLPEVWADPERVQQVLTNLLEYALDYSPHGESIEIHLYPRRTIRAIVLHPFFESDQFSQKQSQCYFTHHTLYVCVTVRDHGVGIPSLQRAQIFKPFQRLVSITMHKRGDIGLYLSRKLIEAMHGHLILRSRVGHGASITFTLPAQPC